MVFNLMVHIVSYIAKHYLPNKFCLLPAASCHLPMFLFFKPVSWRGRLEVKLFYL